MELLEGKTAIITGAAQGLGRACAELFSEQGARLVLADISPEVEQVATGLSRGHEAQGLVADLTDESAAQAVCEKAVESYGGIDILVNAAGTTQVHGVAETTLAEWQRTLQTNLTSQFLMMRGVLPTMRTAGGGSIVNIGSISSNVGLPDQGAYAPAKAGVLMLTKQSAIQYAQDKIRVNCVCPGPMMTPMLRKNADAYPDPQAWLDWLAREVPLGRISDPKEVGRAVLFLASDWASYVTGCILDADGGWVAK